MPFDPSPDTPGMLVCTLCSTEIAVGELIGHVCVPKSVRDRAAAAPAAPPPAAPAASEPVGAPSGGTESLLGVGGPVPGAIPSILEEPPAGGVFGTEPVEGVEDPGPIYFTLGGQKFRGVEALSLGVQMDVAKAFETNVIPSASLVSLIRGIVHPDDEARFEEVIYSKTIRIDAEELRDALVSVIRAIAGRPSPRSSA